jgi:alcohol dehydrogenase class IV
VNQLFSIARLPRIEFGAGAIRKIPEILARYGKRLLVVSGGQSLQSSPQWAWLNETLQARQFDYEVFKVSGEPSPALVDEAVARFRNKPFDVVLGIGGGSVLDAAKAIAGLLKPGNSVMDHLEGVGPELPYLGSSTPFVAVPTTAGTGSEATKNAVLSTHGKNGFKKSFRDEQLVPEYAVVDPDLLASCPQSLIAANGMDAFTQLLESYVSSKANPLTDALAWSGMEAARDGLLAWHEGGEDAAAGREKMAYAALLSGITLAQVGLGSVHGLAAPLGAFHAVPHGMACGILLPAATRVNIEALEARDPIHPALAKFARVGRMLARQTHLDDTAARAALLQELSRWSELMRLPRLGAFGIVSVDLAHIVAHSRGSSMKTNPVDLSDAEVGSILSACL